MSSSNIKKNRFQILSMLPANCLTKCYGSLPNFASNIKAKVRILSQFFATSHNSESKSAVLKKL